MTERRGLCPVRGATEMATAEIFAETKRTGPILGPARIPERDELLARVDALAGRIRATAREAEARRAVPPDLLQTLADEGLFRFMTARDLGGLEADPLTQIEVIEALCHADGSIGWTTGIGAMQNALATALADERVVEELLADPIPIIAGHFAPRGRAVEEAGGFRLDGHWSFASGASHATWFIASCVRVRSDALAPPPGGLPEMLSFLVPRRDVEVIDNWHVSGLRATASSDYAIRGLRVEARYAYSPRSGRRRGGALFAFPLFSFLGTLHAGLALGIARRALDEIRGRAAGKLRIGVASVLAERPVFQQALARAEIALRAARLAVLDAYADLWAAVCAGARATVEQRARVRAAVNHVTDVSLEVTAMAYRYAGGEAIYDESPLQRCGRDIQAAAQHFYVGEDVYERLGRIELGLEGDSPLL